jgi:hypothetical protein
LHLDRSGFVWGAIAPRTKAAMRRMLEQIDDLPPQTTPSPWADPRLLAEWQRGTVTDFVSRSS